MVNNYCRKMTSCDQDYAVLSVTASLERDIGYYCDASGNNFEKVCTPRLLFCPYK